MIGVAILKMVGEFVVSSGVSSVVGNVVKATTPSNIGKVKRFTIGVGSLVLTSMISDAAITYTNKRVKSAFESVKKFVSKDKEVEEIKEEA